MGCPWGGWPHPGGSRYWLLTRLCWAASQVLLVARDTLSCPGPLYLLSGPLPEATHLLPPITLPWGHWPTQTFFFEAHGPGVASHPTAPCLALPQWVTGTVCVDTPFLQGPMG